MALAPSPLSVYPSHSFSTQDLLFHPEDGGSTFLLHDITTQKAIICISTATKTSNLASQSGSCVDSTGFSSPEVINTDLFNYWNGNT
jgi:hypothetical protein